MLPRQLLLSENHWEAQEREASGLEKDEEEHCLCGGGSSEKLTHELGETGHEDFGELFTGDDAELAATHRATARDDRDVVDRVPVTGSVGHVGAHEGLIVVKLREL